ncbi:hypothetical protein ABT56_15970 [Photobacterium aquae]|uniref:Uncharacterized protein n=1 Tax=Photobacterium aquae TaxID=1195763 RepID=A0A0J1GXD9_9GAMM|nr:hypothetical protein [Photobacterium aquae]KLV04104.1 hypothetical protein ABT56_15970 [Photobacterium aquae]
MRRWNVFGFLLLLVLLVSFCISGISIFKTQQYIELLTNKEQAFSLYDKARNNPKASPQDLTRATKLISAELYLLGVDKVYYIDLLGNEILFEPTEADEKQRKLRLVEKNKARHYIKRHLWQNALFMTLLFVYFLFYKRRKNAYNR